MRTVIIDDEDELRAHMKALLAEFVPQVQLVGESNGVQKGIELIQQLQPDLLLLDIEMQDGTGMDIAKAVAHLPVQIIFVTAHDSYALNAFRLNAIDYLLKPVVSDELVEAIAKAEKNLRSNSTLLQIQNLLQNQTTQHASEKKIAVREADSIHFFKVNEIIALEADGSYTKIHLSNSAVFTASRNLKEYEKMLQEFGFIRTHHSFLVNPTKIARFDKKEGGMLIMENNLSVPVSHRKRDNVLDILARQ